jgi:hypothetical protein
MRGSFFGRARWAISALALVSAVSLGHRVGVGRPLHAAPQATADARVPVLVELFTSEGCSDCPPADAVLRDLVTEQTVPGALVIGLSEHVTYWDNLGWRDPFSSATVTTRQAAYDDDLRTDPYTPQMIVDGKADLVGSNRTGVVMAIKRAAAQPKSHVTLTWASGTPLSLHIAIHPVAKGMAAKVRMVVTEDDLTSSVARGENAGHRLTHVAVVRRWVELGKGLPDGGYDGQQKIELDPAWHRDKLHVVVFAQTDHWDVTAVDAITIPPAPLGK